MTYICLYSMAADSSPLHRPVSNRLVDGSVERHNCPVQFSTLFGFRISTRFPSLTSGSKPSFVRGLFVPKSHTHVRDHGIC